MSTIATGNITPAMREGIRSFFGQKYNSHEKQYPGMFEMVTSRKGYEIDQQLEGFGLAPVKTEGAGTAFDSQQTGYSPKYANLTYSLGYIVTKEAMEDNLYNLFPKKSAALAFSMAQTYENIGANVYNRGFNNAYLMTGGDGVELFSQLHVRGPSDASTYSNELATPASLSPTSVQDMLIQINQATDARGNHISIMGQKLIVPSALQFKAETIIKSTLQSGTAENDINAIRSTGMLPQGYMVNNYLSSSTAWFIKTNCPDGMKFQERQAVMFEQDNDFGTSNARFKATGRCAAGWTDPRGSYGSAGV